MIRKFTKLLGLLLFAFAFANGQDSTATKKQRTGIDGGMGKDDYSITFRIGESFGR